MAKFKCLFKTINNPPLVQLSAQRLYIGIHMLFLFSFFLFHWKFETCLFGHFWHFHFQMLLESGRADIQPKSSILWKRSMNWYRRWIFHSTQIATAFEVFDEKEMFAIVMEPEPGGELLDKVVKVYEKETCMVEEIKDCKFICGSKSIICGQYFLA